MNRTNAGWFRRGHDPRRHPLTIEERRRGGETSWKRFMIRWRLESGLPIPTPTDLAILRYVLAEMEQQRLSEGRDRS